MTDAQDHYWIDRPVGEGGSNWPANNYLYGSDGGGKLAVHHGVDMAAPMGTPLLAVAPGAVVTAGDDYEVLYGKRLGFYGLLVVIELDQQLNGQPVYLLYGHLSQVLAQVGERVEAGQLVGLSGASGAALGPHLHFEVRVGANDYAHTRNPQLWMRPFEDRGSVAARVVGPGDGLYYDYQVVLSRAASPRSAFRKAWTYVGDTVKGDDIFNENVVFGDILAGPYWLRGVLGQFEFAVPVLVVPGHTTVVTLELPAP